MYNLNKYLQVEEITFNNKITINKYTPLLKLNSITPLLYTKYPTTIPYPKITNNDHIILMEYYSFVQHIRNHDDTKESIIGPSYLSIYHNLSIPITYPIYQLTNTQLNILRLIKLYNLNNL